MKLILKVIETHPEPWKHYQGMFVGVQREENYSATLFWLFNLHKVYLCNSLVAQRGDEL